MSSSLMTLGSASELRAVLSRRGPLKVTLMGIGRFGGGIGAAAFFCRRGDRVTVTDQKPAEKLGEALDALRGQPIQWHLGGHDGGDFASADLVVASPAVPRTHAMLERAARSGAVLTSEMNLFLALCPAAVVGVTGSNGKSTTTKLLAEMLEKGPRRVFLGGNIGRSLLPEVESIGPGDLAVLELSSFMLEDAAGLGIAPHAAVITNLAPNHLDRHGTCEAYYAAKKLILAGQRPGDLAVLNGDDAVLHAWRGEARGESLEFSLRAGGAEASWTDGALSFALPGRPKVRVALPAGYRLKGRHNIANVLAAGAAALWLGVSPAQIEETLASFQPLEHRIELAAERGGLEFYNDSIATTPESAVAAIDAFSEDGKTRPITLIAGGYDKKVSFEALARKVVEQVDLLVTLGQTGPIIASLTREAGAQAGRAPEIAETDSLAAAVDASFRRSAAGAVVLLSPACASYDMFQNFEQRGRLFKEMVRALPPCR